MALGTGAPGDGVELPPAKFRVSPVADRGFLSFSQVIETNGKLFLYLNLSQVQWRDGVPKCEIPRIEEVGLSI